MFLPGSTIKVEILYPVYFIIDRLLANTIWFQDNSESTMHILPPNISDHALHHLSVPKNRPRHKVFRFSNHLTDIEGYHNVVKESWIKPAMGRPMNVLWYKLKRLKSDSDW